MDPAVLKALIKDSKKTKRLDLSHNNLDVVPDEVVKVHHLEKLILNNNNITEVPPELLKNNKDLSEIDLSYNKLQSLPEDIDSLNNIEYFNASNNQLKTIPSSYEKLFFIEKAYLYRRRRLTSTYTMYRTFHQARINLSNNPDLEIDPAMAADEPGTTRDLLMNKKRREEQAREEQIPIQKAQFEQDKEREVEFNEKRRQARKQNEKERTKSRRLDRH